MEYLVIGIAIVLNVAFIKFKFDRGHMANAVFDLGLLITVMMVFSGTYGALAAGTIGSALISLYLWYSPLTMPKETLS